MSTLSEIRDAVKLNWPTGFYSSNLTNTKIEEYINNAQRSLCLRHNFTFMEREVRADTVDSQRRYDLPVGLNYTLPFKSEISLELFASDGSRVILKKLFKPSIEVKRLFQDTTDIGTPTHYCIQNGYIELWPLPNHADNEGEAWVLNLEYYGYLSKLSGDDDANYLSVYHPEYLEYDATAQGYYFAEDIEKVAFWSNRANDILNLMIKEDNIRANGNISEGLKPASGQSIGNSEEGYIDLDAHYA